MLFLLQYSILFHSSYGFEDICDYLWSYWSPSSTLFVKKGPSSMQHSKDLTTLLRRKCFSEIYPCLTYSNCIVISAVILLNLIQFN